MRVLVTGGSGFVGSYVVRELIKAGKEVVNFDSVFPKEENCKFVRGDILNFEQLLEVLEDIDVICHIAAIGDVYFAERNPVTATKTNVVGTANLLEAARRKKIKRFIYASTWEVYGDVKESELTEDTASQPSHPYNVTKYCGDLMVQCYNKFYGLPTVVLRMGTVYGVGMRDTAVIPLFILKALRGEALTIHGSGEQGRQFVHVRDIAKAFVKVVDIPVTGVFNLAGNEMITVKMIADKLKEKNPSLKLQKSFARKGEIKSIPVSSRKARELLNWHPEVSFDEGFEELFQYYESNKSD